MIQSVPGPFFQPCRREFGRSNGTMQCASSLADANQRVVGEDCRIAEADFCGEGMRLCGINGAAIDVRTPGGGVIGRTREAHRAAGAEGVAAELHNSWGNLRAWPVFYPLKRVGEVFFTSYANSMRAWSLIRRFNSWPLFPRRSQLQVANRNHVLPSYVLFQTHISGRKDIDISRCQWEAPHSVSCETRNSNYPRMRV